MTRTGLGVCRRMCSRHSWPIAACIGHPQSTLPSAHGVALETNAPLALAGSWLAPGRTSTSTCATWRRPPARGTCTARTTRPATTPCSPCSSSGRPTACPAASLCAPSSLSGVPVPSSPGAPRGPRTLTSPSPRARRRSPRSGPAAASERARAMHLPSPTYPHGRVRLGRRHRVCLLPTTSLPNLCF